VLFGVLQCTVLGPLLYVAPAEASIATDCLDACLVDVEAWLKARRLKARPHCLNVASDFVECYKIDCSGNMLLVRSTKLLVRSTSRMLHVASVSTPEQHVEHFDDKKSLFATRREKLNVEHVQLLLKLNMFNFW
jgi:hypothetical protein